MPEVEIYLILDGSGSMGKVQDEVVKGINVFIDDQKEERKLTGDDIKFSLTVFDDKVMEPYVAEDIDFVHHVSKRDTLLGGSTALLDAIGRTLTQAENRDTPAKKLVAIYTDGQENASREFTTTQIDTLVKRLEATGNWQVVYMSAELADFSQPRAIGMAAGNVMVGTTRGTTQSHFHGLSQGASLYRTSASGATAGNFYGATADVADWGATGGTVAGTPTDSSPTDPPEPKKETKDES